MLVVSTGYDILGLTSAEYTLLLQALETQRNYSHTQEYAIKARELRDKLSAVEEG
jgi:hypothetical protein